MISAAWLSQQRARLGALVLLSIHEAGTAIIASRDTAVSQQVFKWFIRGLTLIYGH